MTRLCEVLADRGAHVNLLSQEWPPLGHNILPDPQWVRTRLVRAVHSSRFRMTYSSRFSDAILDLSKEQGIEIIHDHGLWLHSNHAAASASRRLGVPLIISPRGMLEPWLFHTGLGKSDWLGSFSNLEIAVQLW